MSKILIFSDTHLTDKFDNKKYEYLKKLIGQYDTVVINGDFWSYYSTTFDQFVKSEWKSLFPNLRGKAVYIYGNHDRKEWCDERVELFSKIRAQQYKIAVGDNVLLVEHGHNIALDSINNETYIKFNRMLRVDKFKRIAQELLIKSFGVEYYNRIGKRLESKYKDFANDLEKGEILVIGHTHSPNLSLGEKYINTGYISFGEAFYLDIVDDAIRLMHEKY